MDNYNYDFDFSEYIESLIEPGEAVDMEFKSAQGGFPRSFWETYSSFANTQGGVIVLGVREDGCRIIIEGLLSEQVTKYKKEFWNNANNPKLVNANIVKESDVIVGQYEGKQLLLIRIPRAERSIRPVYLTTNPFGGNTFKRNNDGDYKCTDIEVKRMIADSDELNPQDSRILLNYTSKDIDLDSLKQYRQLLAISHPNHPWLSLEDIGLLEMLGGYRRNKSSHEEGYTLAGLLMFGKYHSIIQPECAPNYFPDYREKLTSDVNIRWTDRICPDGTWEANLFQFYLRIFNKMTAILPKPFKLQDTVRIDDSPTHIALREAFVNLLIHANYTTEGNLIIENAINKITFSNPGTLLISRAQYYEGGVSVCRNKSIQNMFTMIGRAERAGSGVDKILEGWQQADFRSPYIEERNNPERVILELPMVSLLPKDTIDAIRERFGPDITQKITHNQLIILATCYTEDDVTNDMLQCFIAKHSVDITKLLKELCRDGYIVSHGSGRGTKYNLNTDYRYINIDELFADYDYNVDSSPSNMDSSPSNMDSSPSNMDSSPSKRRLSKEAMEKLVISVAVDYMAVDTLAQLIKRDIKYLKNKIIPSMIDSDKLERLYPKTPNHPQQKYKAKL